LLRHLFHCRIPFLLSVKAPKLWLVLGHDVGFKYVRHGPQNFAYAPYAPEKAGIIQSYPNIIATIRQASVRIGSLIWHDMLADAKFFKAAVEYIITRDFFNQAIIRRHCTLLFSLCCN